MSPGQPSRLGGPLECSFCHLRYLRAQSLRSLDHLQVDLAHAALDIDIQGDVRVAVGAVDVRISLPLESLGVDLAQAALGFRLNPNLAGQEHRCLPNPPCMLASKSCV